MEAKLIRLDELVEFPQNAKSHDLGSIHASISEWGYIERIVVNETTGHILSGHGRTTVLRQLQSSHSPAPEGIVEDNGSWMVPVDFVSVPESQEGAVTIALNRTVELGGWDNLKLAELLQEVANSAEVELESVGFDGDDLDNLLKDLGQYEDPPDDPGAQINKADELREKWGVQLGQLWVIPSASGEVQHRILCGDSADADDVARLMGGAKAEMCVTSPPYFNQRPEYSTFKSYSEYNDFLSKIADNIIMIAGDIFILAWNTGDNQPDCLPMIADQTCLIHSKGLVYLDTIVWRKSGAVYSIPRSAHIKTHQYFYPALAWEPIIIFRKGDKMPKFEKRDVEDVSSYGVNVWDINQVIGAHQQKQGHPAMYPIEIPTRVIKSYTFGGAAVYDPFLGSGTTIVACEQTGRIGYGMEISPAYTAVSLQRLSDLGIEPRLHND